MVLLPRLYADVLCLLYACTSALTCVATVRTVQHGLEHYHLCHNTQNYWQDKLEKYVNFFQCSISFQQALTAEIDCGETLSPAPELLVAFAAVLVGVVAVPESGVAAGVAVVVGVILPPPTLPVAVF
jgi:hypothetical protein